MPAAAIGSRTELRIVGAGLIALSPAVRAVICIHNTASTRTETKKKSSISTEQIF